MEDLTPGDQAGRSIPSILREDARLPGRRIVTVRALLLPATRLRFVPEEAYPASRPENSNHCRSLVPIGKENRAVCALASWRE